MQVILLQHVARVGRQYDVVDISDGYANNFLFPRKLAERATPEKVTALKKKRETARAAEDARMAEMHEKLTELADATIVMEVRADNQGHLFKKIRAADITALLKDEHGLEIPDEAVLLDAPLNELGDHEVSVNVAEEETRFTVELVAAD